MSSDTNLVNKSIAYIKQRPKFRQGDLRRAVKGVLSAGVSVTKVDIDPDGKITIFSIADCSVAAKKDSYSDWKASRHAN